MRTVFVLLYSHGYYNAKKAVSSRRIRNLILGSGLTQATGTNVDSAPYRLDQEIEKWSDLYFSTIPHASSRNSVPMIRVESERSMETILLLHLAARNCPMLFAEWEMAALDISEVEELS
jgi:hypothetical protein